MTLTVLAPDGVPEIRPGDDLAALVVAALSPVDGDVVLVTSKVVSKAEGRSLPGTDRIAAVEAELAEPGARVVARRGPTTIVRTRLGLTLAAAGVDASNVAPGSVLLLPLDPDGSARALRRAVAERTGANVGVVVTDTAGRAWRTGQTDIAIGAAGITVVDDHTGRTDGYGNELMVTAPALADELAGRGRAGPGQAGRPAVRAGAGPGRPGAAARRGRAGRRGAGPRRGRGPVRVRRPRGRGPRPGRRAGRPGALRCPRSCGGDGGCRRARFSVSWPSRSGTPWQSPRIPGWRRWRSRTAGISWKPPKKVLRKQ